MSAPKTVRAYREAAAARREGYSTRGQMNRVRLERMAKRGDKRAQEVLDQYEADQANTEGDMA